MMQKKISSFAVLLNYWMRPKHNRNKNEATHLLASSDDERKIAQETGDVPSAPEGLTQSANENKPVDEDSAQALDQLAQEITQITDSECIIEFPNRKISKITKSDLSKLSKTALWVHSLHRYPVQWPGELPLYTAMSFLV